MNDEEFRLRIDRPVFDQTLIDEKFKYVRPEKRKRLDVVKTCLKKNFTPSKKCFLNAILTKLTIINLFRTYKLRYVLKDFMSGLTVGIIQIAPTMANATTANLPPINGLYVAFFSVIAYLIFGTSKHLSLGTHGVISIMVGNCVRSFEGILYPASIDDLSPNKTENTNYLSHNPEEAKILIAMTLAIFAGTMQLLLGLLNGGFVSKYMSDNLVEALTIGSSYLIVVSQIDALLGIKITRLRLPFRLIENIIGIFAAIPKTNWVTVVISVLSIVVIYTVKRFINEKFKKKLPAPIPIELIVVIIATVLTSSLSLNENYGVSIVGPIPLGIPAPSFPPLRIFAQVFLQSFSIALVAFALNISTAKYYAKKCNYRININQELIAYGTGNILSGLFRGMPATGGLTRTRIVETSGAKTQMYSLVSSMFVLIVIVGLGFLFRDLPNCCLAAIIFTALINNCFEVTKFIKLLKISKTEAIIWFSTFAGVMILDIDYGLYIGLVVSILTVIIRSQLTPAVILGNIPGTEMYEDIDKCLDAREIENIKIIRYQDSIFYANAESFTNRVFNKLDIDVEKISSSKAEIESEGKKKRVKKSWVPWRRKVSDAAAPSNVNTPQDVQIEIEPAAKKDQEQKKINDLLSEITFEHLILDCSCVNSIDMMGSNAIIQLEETCKKLGIQLHITHLKKGVFERASRITNNKLDAKQLYPTNHDAVMRICKKYYVKLDENNSNELPKTQILTLDDQKVAHTQEEGKIEEIQESTA